MGAYETDLRRDLASRVLLNHEGAARYVVGIEETRVEELLDETYSDPYKDSSKIASVGRAVLQKVRLHTPKTATLVERPWLEGSQQAKFEDVRVELERSRGILRSFSEIDATAIDAKLRLDSADSIVPPIFRHAHRATEDATNRKINFTDWMASHATDAQLLNVWQWHDTYLRELDTNPEFIEQVATVKEQYRSGMNQAISKGILDPAMAVSEKDFGNIYIRHGSPFSPLLATSRAYADRRTRRIQLSGKVSDFTLTHELTHVVKGGLVFELDEGATDLIAGTVYNESRPGSEHVDVKKHVYGDQIATLKSLERLSSGRLNLREISQCYAGNNPVKNTARLISRVDASVGLPASIALLKTARAGLEQIFDKANDNVVRQIAQLLLRKQTEFMTAMIIDPDGKQVAHTLPEIAQRIMAQDALNAYDKDTIAMGVQTLIAMQKISNES